MVVALTIMAALHGYIEVSTTSCHDLQIRQPHIFQQRLMWLFGHKLANMTQKKEFTPQGGEIATLIEEGSRIGEHLFPLTQISAKRTHCLVVQPQPKRINNVHLLHSLILMCIGKAHAVVIADIGFIGVGGHPLDFSEHSGEVGVIGQQPQDLEHRCCSAVPIARSFIASAILRIGIDEGPYGLTNLSDGFSLASLILLTDKHTSQPVGTDPWIPVHACRLPPVVFLHSRL